MDLTNDFEHEHSTCDKDSSENSPLYAFFFSLAEDSSGAAWLLHRCIALKRRQKGIQRAIVVDSLAPKQPETSTKLPMTTKRLFLEVAILFFMVIVLDQVCNFIFF